MLHAHPLEPGLFSTDCLSHREVDLTEMFNLKSVGGKTAGG